MNIAIQGIRGSYHHAVADILFPAAKITTCTNFSDIPPLLIEEQADAAVMAIENSIAGAILPNYALIDEYNLQITGEYYLPIQHQLMALKGQSLTDIKEVWSHPMALEQCRKFFRDHPDIKLIEEKDTAEVALIIQQKQLMGIAAIAGKNAAQIYSLNIIASDIQTHPENYTRFVLLGNAGFQETTEFNKISLKFTLPHQVGGLFHILEVLNDNNLSMSKIQSLPIVDKPWEYAFFVDVLVTEEKLFYQAEKEIVKLVNEIKILGQYKNNRPTKVQS